MDEQQERVEGKDFVTYRWAKKIVDKNDPRGVDYYRKSYGYHVLTAQGAAAVVAFKFIINRGPVPHHIDFCTDSESAELDKKYGTVQIW